MRKNIKILLTITIITIILLVGVIINLISNNKTQLLNKSQIIKEMSSSAQETELNNQINALNAEHTEYMNYIQKGKTSIATALTNQGVTTSNEATLETMAENISKVLQTRTADATATADNIIEGKTAYVNGNKVTGTMKNNALKGPYDFSATSGFASEQGLEEYVNGSSSLAYTYLTKIEGYNNLTLDDMIITFNTLPPHEGTGSYTYSSQYYSSNGLLIITPTPGRFQRGTCSIRIYIK